MVFFKFGQSSWPSFTFKEDFLNIFHFIMSFFQALSKRFFLSVFFFTNIDDSKDRRGRGKAIYLSSFYHFHWLCKYLGIIRAITLEISTLHMASSWTETTNLLFPSICRHPLSYAFHRQIINYTSYTSHLYVIFSIKFYSTLLYSIYWNTMQSWWVQPFPQTMFFRSQNRATIHILKKTNSRRQHALFCALLNWLCE